MAENTENGYPRKKLARLRRKWWVALLLVCAVGAAWLGVSVYRIQRRQAAVEHFERFGGTVCYAYQLDKSGNVRAAEPPGPRWGRRLLGDNALATPVRVLTTSNELQDSDLAALQWLPDVEQLSLSHAGITDAGLAPLEGLVKLKRLSLEDTRITGSGLKHVRGLPELTELDLTDTDVAEEGLAQLQESTTLRVLQLAGTAIDDQALSHLSKLTALEELDISGTRVTNAGLLHLSELTELRRLDVSSTEVSIMGLFPLYRATDLANVRFSPGRTAFEVRHLFQKKQQLYASRDKEVPKLIDGLADPSARVRMNCVERLGDYAWVDDERAVAALLEKGLQDDDPKVRIQLLIAFSHIERPEALTLVIAALADEDADVRMAAVDSLLGLARDLDEAKLALVQKALHSRDGAVRFRAAECISTLDPPAAENLPVAIKTLGAFLTDDGTDEEFREMLSKTVQKWKDKLGSPHIPPADANPQQSNEDLNSADANRDPLRDPFETP